MTRGLLTLLGIGLVCAVVGAQSPPVISILDQNRLLQRNRSLLRELVGQSIQLSQQRDPLLRLAACQPVITKLSQEIRFAAESKDANRVVELGKHLDKLLLDGVTPNFQRARGRIKAGSLDEKKMIELRDTILQNVEPLNSVVPPESRLGKSREVSDVMRQLLDAQAQIRKASGS